MKRYAMLLHNRNKVHFVGDAIRSMFAQVGPPIELLLSDSGSTDGSQQVMDQLAASYNGPHKVRRLDCPCADSPGMPGLNAHLNWAMTQTDADVVMPLSGDDYDLAQRSELTIKAFEEHDPSMVLCAMYYVDPEMHYKGETPWPQQDGLVVLEDVFPKFVGGSTIQAWTAEFFHKVGGLDGVGSPDVVLPFLACLDKGAYYVHTRCHCYREVVGPENTGLESVYKAFPEGAPERTQIEELVHFQVMAGHYATLRKLDKLVLPDEVRTRAGYCLANAILDRSASWVNVRQRMSLEGIPPIPFRA